MIAVLVNMISFVDHQSKHKTPIPMSEQVEIIKQLMVDYNGEALLTGKTLENFTSMPVLAAVV